jgi:hypothetical protein
VPAGLCSQNWRKLAGAVSDRALRYRSRQCVAPGPRICVFCGSTANVEVHHINGFEEDTDPINLAWACRSCNVRAGIAMKRAGLGRKIRQFNPQSQGAKSLGQWLTAVLSMKGESDAMDTAAAVDMIRATPPERRSEFARRIWGIRRSRGTDRKA